MKHLLNEEKVNALLELDDSGEVLKELIDLFLSNTSQKLLSLAQSPGVRESNKRIAHELRSSSANLGADALSQMASDLEYLPESSDYQVKASELIQNMQSNFDEVKTLLLKYS